MESVRIVNLNENNRANGYDDAANQYGRGATYISIADIMTVRMCSVKSHIIEIGDNRSSYQYTNALARIIAAKMFIFMGLFLLDNKFNRIIKRKINRFVSETFGHNIQMLKQEPTSGRLSLLSKTIDFVE